MTRTSLLPALVLAAALSAHAAPDAAADPSFRTYTLTLDEPPQALAARLMSDLDGTAQMTSKDGVLYIDYAGLSFPDPLRDLVAAQLDPTVASLLAPGLPVNASLAILPSDAGSELRLVIAMPNPEDPDSFIAPGGNGLPDGATLLMGGGGIDACTGQLVLAQPEPVDRAADLYAGALAAQGFDLSDLSDEKTSFFVGHRPGCTLFLYLQPDPTAPTRTTVVINFQRE